TFGGEWLAPILALATGGGFRRGLVEQVVVDAARFVAQGGELFARAPIRRVWVRATAEEMPVLAACPLLERLAELDLSTNQLGDAAIEVLVGSPHLGRLVYLDLGTNVLHDAGLRAVAAAAGLGGLRALRLTDNLFGGAGAEGLAAA